MAKQQTLFAYVGGENGATHDDALVQAVETRLDALIAARKWASKDVWVVNQREPPHWDLGLNVAVPAAAARTRSSKWIDDVVAIANELAILHGETKRQFVIGIHDGATDVTKDLFVVDSASPDLEKLRASLTLTLTAADK